MSEVITLDKYYDTTTDGDTFENPFSFELDGFQKNAVNIIRSGDPYNILVTAHTGSGKSLVAEYAIMHNKSIGKRTIYTSPIKSLSNQKFFEFSQKFKDSSIGIVTGDCKFNTMADVLIMTTEILLNVINFSNNNLFTASSTNIFDVTLDDVNTIIFDEVHYINDDSRGNIWEQCIMKIPANINQVLLSATIEDSEKFAKWIQRCNGLKTYILPNFKRVVPLYFNAFYTINESVEKVLNKDAITKPYLNNINKLIPITNTENNKVDMQGYENLERMHKFLVSKELNKISPASIINKTIQYLDDNLMTPCLFFVLSRNKIHQLIDSCSKNLNSHLEQAEVDKLFDAYLSKLSVPKEEYYKIPMIPYVKSYLCKGIGIHHSGLLPILKEVIELLYAKGLIKVLFATETFSVGLNMPTKTVVFTSLNKYDGSSHRFLFSHEFIQMSGRAGRRGIDTLGNVIYLPQLERYFTTSSELKCILVSKPQKIASKYIVDPINVLKGIYNKYNINEDVSRTMWFIEKSVILKGLVKEMNNLEQIITDHNFPVFEYDKLFKDYLSITDGTMKVQGWKKRLQMIKNEVNTKHNFDNQYKLWQQYYDLNLKLTDIKSNIKYYDNIIDESINICLTFLEEFNYIKHTPNENIDTYEYELTNLGLCAAMLGDECNCLLLSKIITSDLSKYKTDDIISILSIFCDGSNDDDVFTENKSIREYYSNIESQQISMINYLNRLGIKAGPDWQINQSNIDIISYWISDKDIKYQEIFNKYQTYEGNFLKNIIKLNKITESIYKVALNIGNITLADKLADYNTLLVKDIINTESIYVNL